MTTKFMQNTFIVKIWQKLPPKKSQIKTCPNLGVDLKGPTKYKEKVKNNHARLYLGAT